MKRVVISSTVNQNPFNVNSTGTSYYDEFLTEEGLEYMQSAKNLTGKIVEMTPNEYYQACSEIFNKPVDSLIIERSSDSKLIKQYQRDMRKGDKFPLCFVNYAKKSQEGLHRMMAAGNEFGWDTKFPVLEVSIYDQAEEDRRALNIEIYDYMDYDLKEICDEVSDNLSEEYSSAPPNLEGIFKSQVIELAKSQGHSIDVDVEITDSQGDLCLRCYLTSYDGHDVTYTRDSAGKWLVDMFDDSEGESSEDLFDEDLFDEDLFDE